MEICRLHIEVIGEAALSFMRGAWRVRKSHAVEIHVRKVKIVSGLRYQPHFPCVVIRSRPFWFSETHRSR